MDRNSGPLRGRTARASRREGAPPQASGKQFNEDVAGKPDAAENIQIDRERIRPAIRRTDHQLVQSDESKERTGQAVAQTPSIFGLLISFILMFKSFPESSSLSAAMALLGAGLLAAARRRGSAPRGKHRVARRAEVGRDTGPVDPARDLRP